MSFWKGNIGDYLNVFFLTLFSLKKNLEKIYFAKINAREKNFSDPSAKVYAREMQKLREFFSSRKFLLAKVSDPKVISSMATFSFSAFCDYSRVLASNSASASLIHPVSVPR